ncbi:hypothetical protein MRX96_036614 [Rhipicephalus microplus]
MERTAKGLRTCLFVLQYVAVFAAGVPVAGLRESFALSDGIREAAPSPDLPLSDGICAVAPSPDLPETACWDLTNIVERHLQHHQCAAATSTSSCPDRIRPSIEHYHCSGHGSAMERTAKGLRTCLFVLQYVAVFAAGVPVAGLRESFALSDGIREAAPSPDLPLSDGICAVAPSPDLPETACWDLTNIVERHLQHHQCAAATSTSSCPDRIRPSIEHYHCSGHGSAMERTAKGLRTCLFVLQYVAVFAAGVPVAGLRESFALSDGIREAAPSPDLPLSDGICAVAPSPDLPETACWDLTNIVERHLQHHQSDKRSAAFLMLWRELSLTTECCLANSLDCPKLMPIAGLLGDGAPLDWVPNSLI